MNGLRRVTVNLPEVLVDEVDYESRLFGYSRSEVIRRGLWQGLGLCRGCLFVGCSMECPGEAGGVAGVVSATEARRTGSLAGQLAVTVGASIDDHILCFSSPPP
jgi:hypothetical protein